MQSFVLAVVVILMAGPVRAAESGRVVPPIPGPDQAMTPVVPLDRQWPAGPESAEPTPAREVPAIPAPSFAAAAPEPMPPTPLASALPPIPGPHEPMTPISPLDEPWDMTAEVDPRAIPAIPAPQFATLARANAPVPAKLAPGSTGASTTSRSTAQATMPAPKPGTSLAPLRSEGTVHVVAEGDTLWDISNLYLGTPWIWPSVWQDNEAVENPHLIFPGDKIWVSATEMRKLTDAEAEALMAGQDDDVPAAMAEDLPAVPVPEAPQPTFHYVKHSSLGLVSKDDLEDLPKVVGTTEEQILLAQGDTVFVDRGEGEIEVGEQYTLLRTGQEVYDPGSHRSLGHHTEVVGWLEIVQVHEKSARAKVQQSYIDFVPGVYLTPRVEDTVEIAVLDSPEGVEGQIADLLTHQKYRGNGDVVVLNRGMKHGVVAGSQLEVYRPIAGNWKDTWYGDRPEIEIPHEVVAELVVLKAEDETAMAYVMRVRANTEIWYGDRFRTVDGPSGEYVTRDRPTMEGRMIRWVVSQGKRLASQMPTPKMPAVVSDWNAPRLVLPSLDGYDPR